MQVIRFKYCFNTKRLTFLNKVFVGIFVFFFVPNTVVSQKNIDHQNLLWTRYTLKLKIDNHWYVNQEIEERTYWFPWRQHQFVLRTLVQYQLGNGWNVGAGLTYFQQSLPQDPKREIDYTQPEIRPNLEIAYRQTLSEKFSLQHRYWTEFRYIKPKNEDLQFGNMRMRYKLELQYLVKSNLTLKIYDEIFVNFGNNIVHNVFDQNRIGGSIQYMPTKHFGFELGYINWYQQRPTGIDFYNRNIVRFTIHQNLTLKKSGPQE